jgi:hypothetical protein
MGFFVAEIAGFALVVCGFSFWDIGHVPWRKVFAGSALIGLGLSLMRLGG